MERAQNLGELATGVPEIDLEHALQVGLIDAFKAAVTSQADADNAGALVERLKDLSNAHFLAEQLLMRLHGYPDYAAHVQEHERLVEALATVQASLASGELEASAQAADLLRHWFVGHVQTLDQTLAAFLKESRRSGASAPASGEPPKPPGVE